MVRLSWPSPGRRQRLAIWIGVLLATLAASQDTVPRRDALLLDVPDVQHVGDRAWESTEAQKSALTVIEAMQASLRSTTEIQASLRARLTKCSLTRHGPGEADGTFREAYLLMRFMDQAEFPPAPPPASVAAARGALVAEVEILTEPRKSLVREAVVDHLLWRFALPWWLAAGRPAPLVPAVRRKPRKPLLTYSLRLLDAIDSLGAMEAELAARWRRTRRTIQEYQIRDTVPTDAEGNGGSAVCKEALQLLTTDSDRQRIDTRSP